MEMKLILAIVAGLLYFFGQCQMFYCFCDGFSWLPLTHGIIFGLITGQLTDGIIIGAAISALYISLVPAGNNTPADCTAAGTIAIPIALMSNMDVAAATALAVSVAIVGNLLQPIQFNLNGVYAHMADKCAEDGDLNGIVRTNWYAMLSTLALRFPVAFAAVFFGADVIDKVMAAMPVWLSNGLTVAGGVLPALGIAATLVVINKDKYLPLFLFGYFFVVVLNISVLAASILGICAVVLYVVISMEDHQEIMQGLAADEDEDDDD